jgi:hypothetical protein
MRVPKRCYLGGLITKATGRGIFVLGPKEHVRRNREKKIGWFNPAVQAELGKKGGAKKSPAKTAACRKNGALSRSRFDSEKQAERGRCGAKALWGDLVFREMMRWHCTPFSAWEKAARPVPATRHQRGRH